MSRINTNVQSLLARRVLNTNIAAQHPALERLSTGLRINRGKNDPAGLIASETLRNAEVAIGAAIDNWRRADSALAVAEGSLQEISSRLLELENLIDRSASEAGLSSEEVAANQLQIDAILDSINRIADSTAFGDRKLINGSLEFTVSGSVTTNTEFDEGVGRPVTINGRNATVNGLTASVSSTSLSAELILAEDFARMAAGVGTSASFKITGGGAIFAISPDLGLAGQASLGLQSVSAGSLGNGVDGFLSGLGTGQTNSLANKNYASAQRTVRSAINQVSSLRRRIGAFQKNTLQTNINALAVALENITAAESAIRDADFAVETSALTRAQILVSSSTATLQLAKAAPQNVLALLG